MLSSSSASSSSSSSSSSLPPSLSSVWIQRHLEPQAESLLEQSARGVAKSWMKLDCVVSELEAMGQAPASLPFKMAVAVYLRGRHLASFLEHLPQGLFGLMVDASPNATFFRLLSTCIGVSNGVFEDDGVRKRVRAAVKSFGSDCLAKQVTYHALHWHGLTSTFNGDMTSFPEGAMKYYRQLARRGIECNKLDVPYPLPRELVMRGPNVERDRRKQFVLDSCAYMSEFCRDRNPNVEAVARDRRGLERCDDWMGGFGGSHEDSSLEQFVLVLCCIAASSQAGRPHAVIFLSFLLLLGPCYFFVEKVSERVWRRKFRTDVYNQLAVALASFFVSPDVVFCCLDLAQINPHSTEWECALARQRVFACYGLYAEERASFEKWRQRVPAVSWIYDEMVMSHVGSQFHHLQESMLEVLVYRQMHRRCPPANACFRASDPFKADIEERMMRLLCVIHSTASGLNISEHLRANLCVSLAVFKCIRVSFQWMYSVVTTDAAPLGAASGLTHLRLASRVLSSQVRNCLSRHLVPFLFPIPEGNLSWPDFVRNQLLEDNRDSLFTWWRNSRAWADRCYSLQFFLLHLTSAEMATWPTCESYLSLCDKIIELYEASSSKRHHRLPVLRLLRARLHRAGSSKGVCPLGLTKGHVAREGLLLVDPSAERLLAHFMAREPVLAPLILDFGRAATRFHSTF